MSVSPFGNLETQNQNLNDSTGVDSDGSDLSEGTNVDIKRTISVQTDLKFNRRRTKTSSKGEFKSFQIDDTYTLEIPPGVYAKSDEDWPVREAVMFRLDPVL